MTHEFKKIVNAWEAAKKQGYKSVLATIVALDGSSYRRPGVRMLIVENGKTIGAVSGGCVEKEIQRQAVDVFKKGTAKLITYDGRYRLGCEGVLYILLEYFDPAPVFLDHFYQALAQRISFKMLSYYQREECIHPEMGSFAQFSNSEVFPMSEQHQMPGANHELHTFTQQMPPCFKLVIIGAEHDAVQLCSFAAMCGWEVTVVTLPTDPKMPVHFPGAHEVCALDADALDKTGIDDQTAVVLMTHNFASDVKYLLKLISFRFLYLGLLGPVTRREKLLTKLMEYRPDVPMEFMDMLYGPAGINIGSESAQEIAISIIAEILSVVRNQQPMLLREKVGRIHS